MNHDKSSFNRMVLLTGARIFGILFSIAIPMYLGRKLSIEMYGTYKQIMLFFWFSQVALNLGMDDSAYFYFRWEPKKFPLFSFNALVFNSVVTGIIWALIAVYKIDISILLGNPALAQYLPLLGLLIFTTVTSMQIEGILIVGLNRFNTRLWVEMFTELFKSLAIISAFYYFNSLYAVIILLSVIMVIRLLIVIAIINHCRRKEGLSLLEARKHFIKQLKFGLPLGFSRVLQNILNMENFFISHFFSLVQFTFYTVGCFENPLINAARASVFELTNIEMVDAMRKGNKEKAVEIWKSMTRKLFLIVIPFVVYMMFFGKELIRFIFSEKYDAAIPFFIIFNLYLFVGALNPEPIFRATTKTNLTLKIKVVGLAIGLGLFILGAMTGGPLYALVGKIVGVFIMNIVGLAIGAKLIDSHLLQLFNWKDLSKTVILSVLLGLVIRIWIWNFHAINSLHVFWVLAYSFSVYVLLHFLLSCKIRLIHDDEIYYLKEKAMKFLLKLARRKNKETESTPKPIQDEQVNYWFSE